MAYRMLIAEDEWEEYELVLYLLKKLKLDSFLEIFHAENGKQAMEILDKTSIELLLTDIEMPYANGLEIAAKARAGNPQLPIIFFSCYDSFSYIKTALSVQADNYLLKPLDPDEFEKTMLHAFHLLQQTDLRRRNRESRILALKNHYLYLKLNRMPCENLPAMERETSFVNLYSMLLLLHFEESFFDCETKDSEAFTDFLRKGFPYPFDFVNLNPSQSVLLFQEESGNSIVQDKLAGFCRQMHEKILESYHIKCYFAFSSPLLEGDNLADAYEDACSLLETRFFCREHYVFHKQLQNLTLPENYDLCSEILTSVKTDIDAGNMEKLTEDILKLNQIFEQERHYSHIYVRHIYSSLIQILYAGRENSEMPGDIERIFSCSFIYEIEQISLDEIAGAVYLNPSYLSTVFKIETGNNINKYIKAVRMEKAKEILTRTNIKVSDAGAAVGFSNTSYFIRSFHEYFGETPDKMRQKQL